MAPNAFTIDTADIFQHQPSALLLCPPASYVVLGQLQATARDSLQLGCLVNLWLHAIAKNHANSLFPMFYCLMLMYIYLLLHIEASQCASRILLSANCLHT